MKVDRSVRFLIFSSFFLLSVFLAMAHAEETPERKMLQAPPRTFTHPPPPPRAPHANRPRAPHGPSGAAESFMQKLQGYKDQLQKNPEDMEALVFLANANFDIQRYENAEKLFLRILKINPNNLHVRTDLASVYRNLGHSDKAVDALNIVLSLNPNHEIALYNIGIILLNDKEDFVAAADAWERLVRINPKDPLAEALREKVKEIRSGKLKPINTKESGQTP